MKNNSPVIYLSFLVLCLIIGCVSCSSNLMKSGNNDWVEYRTNESGNIYFYKYVSIDKNGGNYLVQVLNKCVYSDLGREKEIQLRTKDGSSTKGYDKLSSETYLEQIDCKKQKVRILSIKGHNKNGELLFSYSYDNQDWDFTLDDSVGEYLLKKVCK